jgi:ABC-type transport system substrate-binding protein
VWRSGHRGGARRRARQTTSLVTGLIVTLAATLALAACTPPGLPEPIAPSGTPSTPGTPPGAGTVVVGLSAARGGLTGFNPYLVADYSPTSLAIAQLVLPSAFVTARDGSLEQDVDVVDSAAVTATEPFTVTYTLDPKASWSDGTPISAEDFSFLRSQLVSQPGTASSAAYRLIDAIRSRDAGKTVEVEFAAEVPGWRTLFSPLLPSHLIKDFPGGWTAAMAGTIPVSGNRYRLNSYDPLTGQVTLTRNDKYWATQPDPTTVILRLGAAGDLLQAFTRGDVQALWLTPDGDEVGDVESAVPPERRVEIGTPASVQVVFNTVQGATAVADVRRAVAAAVDLQAVAAVLAGGWLDGGPTVTSQVRLPAQATDGDGENAVETGDPGAAQRFLDAAGYQRNGLYAIENGRLLRLTLAVPSGDARLAAAARLLQRQLGEAGIEVDLLADSLPNLVGTRIAAGDFDMALVTVPRGAQDDIAAATAFSCPVIPAANGDPAVDPLIPATAQDVPPASSEAAPGTEIGAGGTDQPADPGGNLSGFCSTAVQPLLADAITGSGSAGRADADLWNELPVLPLIEPITIFAVSPEIATVLDGPTDGWLWTGPLAGLPDWPVA